MQTAKSLGSDELSAHEFEILIEKILQHFTEPAYRDEVSMARHEFFENAGIIDENAPNFELRMAQFHDWYLFSRELSNEHITPIQKSQDLKEFQHEPTDWVERLNCLGRTQHSLFEFIKSRDNDLFVKDLFGGKKIALYDSPIHIGFTREELFEARIIPYQDNFYFTRSFCFHPEGAKKFILKEIKKVKRLGDSEKQALMLRLLKLRYKYEQYRHIRLEYIYTDDPKLKF